MEQRRWPPLSVTLALSVLVGTTNAQACKDLKPGKPMSFPGLALKPVEAPTRHLAIPNGPLGSVHITLDRGQCYGSCPDYVVELNGDGSGSYTGRKFVLVEGKHTFKISKQSIQCILSHFRRADFWSLKDEYAADVTDGSQSRLALTIGGQTKSLVDYFGLEAGMPGLVEAIEDEIDQTAGIARWVQGTSDTMPSLRAEHFDFHSEAAATLLAMAAGGAPTELVDGLIAAGAPVTGRIVWLGGQKGPTAVEQASRGGRLAVVRAMIARGALDDGLQETRDAALRAATGSGDPQIVAEILQHQPNVNARDPGGNTALFFTRHAEKTGSGMSRADVVGVTRLLIAAGADPNIINSMGETALFHSSDADVVRLLLKSGAKVDPRDQHGNTPLMTAMTDEVAVILIEAGADTTAANNHGWSVEKRLTSLNFIKAAQLLHQGQR